MKQWRNVIVLALALALALAPSAAAPPPSLTISIGDASVAEGASGTTTLTFTISAEQLRGRMTVDWATSDGTAVAPGDYAAGSGSVTLTGKQPSATVSVTVNGDTADEGDETLNVQLSNPSRGTLADDTGVGTIQNDDHTLTVQVQGDGSVTGAGISCPGDCSESYATGAFVQLTAQPGSSASFDGWSGDAASCGLNTVCPITMDSDKSVTATFSPAIG